MMFATIHVHPGIAALAFFQGTQLSLFESFLTQAISGINSTSITSGMQNVAYVVLLIGFLWQVYQASLHGGDVRGLGVSLIKYVVTAVVVMNYSAIFTTVNQGFVNAGNWIGNATGVGNLLDNWKNDISTQYSQDGVQQMWGLVTGSMAGLIDGLLILVAYILYPFVIAIFGFFYIFYGSVLYIFGPIVIALMPLGATNRLAKAYVENVFIWNAWPILYGGFGALLSAVQMGQVGQMLSQNNFLGGLGNLEGSFLIGAASIIYSLAIAVIPFIAKRIVSGEVGATAGTLLGAAATALTAGIAAAEGIGAGVAASSTGASSGAQGSTNGSSTSSASTSPGRGNNQPTAPQRTAPAAQVRQSTSPSSSPTSQGEHVADNIRGSFSEALNNGHVSESSEGDKSVQGGINSQQSSDSQAASGRMTQPATSARASAQSQPTHGGHGPSPALMRPHGLATWGAFHGARLATQGVVGGARAAGAIATGVANPVETAGRIGAKAGQIAGTATNAAVKTATTAAKVASAVTHPRETVGAGVQAVSSAASAAVANTASTIRQSAKAVGANFSEAYEKTHSRESPNNNESA
ncbi:type IV secretion system protein [Granulicella sp. L60]|uniref:type IV secretion system protein n=1 Tax=Granulicella sp. L60 TaxID=1641866 RepID=UPI00131BAC7C|nr:type IV secretion system protein [Granulicella sp. L60]